MPGKAAADWDGSAEGTVTLEAGKNGKPVRLALLAVGLRFPGHPLTREVKGKFFLNIYSLEHFYVSKIRSK